VRVVLDTNVIVSGLLNEFSAPGRVIDLVLSSDVAPVVDPRILSEYADVLRRPKLRLDPDDVALFLRVVEDAEHVTAAPLPFALSDPDDEPFLEVAVAGAVDALVTGNTRHFGLAQGRLAIPVVSPRAFLDRFAGR
jgi:uncharacterized protein